MMNASMVPFSRLLVRVVMLSYNDRFENQGMTWITLQTCYSVYIVDEQLEINKNVQQSV